MTLPDEAVATVFRVLNKCSAEARPVGPWRWHCVIQNGTRLPITASLEDGFLHLAGQPVARARNATELTRVLRRNETLGGGVKFALGIADRSLRLSTDVVLLDEGKLLQRLHWALAGFHDGSQLNSIDSPDDDAVLVPATQSAMDIGAMLHEISWECTERAPNEWSVDLGEGLSSAARVTGSKRGLSLKTELVRSRSEAEVVQRALTVFLLTASSTMRMVRAYSAELEGQRVFGLHVCLMATPVTEEIDHALGALAVAHRMFVREANVLLDEEAARCYLSVGNDPTVQYSEKEN